MTQEKNLFVQKFKNAQHLHKKNLLPQAEEAYLDLLKIDKNQEQTLTALMRIYMQNGQTNNAIEMGERLLLINPDNPIYYENIANLHNQLGHSEKVISCYKRLLNRQPNLADMQYNLAYFLKQFHLYEESIEAYNKALKCNIGRPEEVYLNIAVIYSDHLRQEKKAMNALELALETNPRYVPAMFNLANIYEELGNREKAENFFSRIIDIDPFYYSALARLGDVKNFTFKDDPIIRKMKRAVRKSTIDISTKVNLYFALGKAFNDCEEYDEAFSYYQKANEYNKQTLSIYDKAKQEQKINDLITKFSKNWFQRIEPISEASPIFICGMFRSGSTLTEQILASHPLVIAGGEIDFFIRKIREDIKLYPSSLSVTDTQMFKNISIEYLNILKKLFPGEKYITDKRPDNFIHLGLIKSLFPNAKIIYTRRNQLDNCLSVYFLRLGNDMNYATDLDCIVHYFKQSERLMSHWKAVFKENILEVSYDDLVDDPKPVINDMLNFCGLKWDDSCLEFYKLDNIVKTASVWQVREPLYKRSSGRWRNYIGHIKGIQEKYEYGKY